MKKLLIILVLLAAGFFGYNLVFASSDAYAAYVRFADALLYDRWDEARKVAGSDKIRRYVDDAQALPGRIGPERYRNIRGVVHMGPSRKVESETASPDGDKVTFRVIQDERRGPLTMAPIGRPTVRHTQDVVVVRTPDGWKVESFSEKVEPLD